MPLVLGMVLGSIMIEKLTAGASRVKSWWDLVDRPVSGTLAAVIVLLIIASIVLARFEKNKDT